MSQALESRVAELEAIIAEIQQHIIISQNGVGNNFEIIRELPENDTFNNGDTAWMLTSTVLVLFMTIPGLALYYSGMVRVHNVLATVMQSFSIACLITFLWLSFGYSFAFAPAHSDPSRVNVITGNASRLWLIGLDVNSYHDLAPTIPESVFCTYQLTFAIITPSLICGAFADRMKYTSMLLFMGLWHVLVYCPLAHMSWHPDGFLYKFGTLDYVGGNVVHVSSGFAGLVCALVIGQRSGYGVERFQPHNILITVMGASMLWVGWFGFNAGSAMGATAEAGMAMLNTQISAGCSALCWMLCEWYERGQPSVLGITSGAIAGLICIAPAAGYVGPTGAFFFGIMGGPACFVGVHLKKWFLVDDALDAFGLHGVGGSLGVLLVAFFATSPESDNAGILYGGSGYMFTKQLVGLIVTAAWSSVVTFLILKVIDYTVGLRVSEVKELQGLDTAVHGESIVAGHMATNSATKPPRPDKPDGGEDFQVLLELPSLLMHKYESPAMIRSRHGDDQSASSGRTNGGSRSPSLFGNEDTSGTLNSSIITLTTSNVGSITNMKHIVHKIPRPKSPRNTMVMTYTNDDPISINTLSI